MYRYRYNPQTSIFAGMSEAMLLAALQSAQSAYVELLSGAHVVTASYSQNDGNKSVTYNQASIGGLTALIKQLQAQLGMIRVGRRPVPLTYAR